MQSNFVAGLGPATAALASPPRIARQPTPACRRASYVPTLSGPLSFIMRGPAASLHHAATFPLATSLCSNRHSDRCAAAAHLPRFRALALLGRLPSQRVDRGIIQASEKPAQKRASLRLPLLAIGTSSQSARPSRLAAAGAGHRCIGPSTWARVDRAPPEGHTWKA